MENEVRYWVRTGAEPWHEVTKERFIAEERNAGFRLKGGGDGIATGGFSGRSIQGRITSQEIDEEQYSWDPEFVKAVAETDKANK